MKTSSPCRRNACRSPFAAVAIPKNFKSIGGGGGGPTGPVRTGASSSGVRTLATSFGIATAGAEFGEKMFLPLPEYTSDSVTSIASMCSVGSSGASLLAPAFDETPTVFPEGNACFVATDLTGAAIVAVVTTAAGGGGASGGNSWVYP